MTVTISTADFSLADAYARLRQAKGVGAVCVFTGIVRDWLDAADKQNSTREAGKQNSKNGTHGTAAVGEKNGTAIVSLTLEHYPGMTETKLDAIRTQAMQRWDLLDAMIIHRIGRLVPADHIVLVGTAAKHRHPAFAAAQFIMDYLKTEAPFWKAEETAAGSHWVAAKDSDRNAAKSW